MDKNFKILEKLH